MKCIIHFVFFLWLPIYLIFNWAIWHALLTPDSTCRLLFTFNDDNLPMIMIKVSRNLVVNTCWQRIFVNQCLKDKLLILETMTYLRM